MKFNDIKTNMGKLPKKIFIIYLSTFVNRVGTFVFPFIAVYLTNQRNLSTSFTGFIISFSSIGLLVGNFFSGILADKWNARNIVILSLVINVIGFFGLIYEYENPYIYVLFLFIGLMGMGMFGPGANYIIADITTKEQRSFAFTVHYLCSNIGFGIGPLLGGFLMSQSHVLIFLGDICSSTICIFLLLIGLASYRSSKNKEQRTDRPEQKRLRDIVREYKGITLFCVFGFFIISPLFCMEYIMPLLIKNVFQQSPMFIGAAYTLNSILIITLSLFIEQFIRKKSSILTMVIAGLLWTAGFAIMAVGFSIEAIMISILVWTPGEIIFSITMPTYISVSVDPSVKGRFLALNDGVVSIARIISPITIGFLWESIGINPVLFLITSIPFIGVILYSVYFLIKKRNALQPA